MAFEAHYSRGRLLGLAGASLAFAALGFWMALRADGALNDLPKIGLLTALLGGNVDLAVQGMGWLCALMGVSALPVALRQMRFRGPAIRVDQDGIYYHRWSPKPIGWDNVAGIKTFAVHGQKMICLELRDPSLDPSTTLSGRAARLNGLFGFGQVAIPPQGTDTDFDALAQVIFYHAELHERAKRGAAATLDARRPARRL